LPRSLIVKNWRNSSEAAPGNCFLTEQIDTEQLDD
jgi:hypothetical protein